MESQIENEVKTAVADSGQELDRETMETIISAVAERVVEKLGATPPDMGMINELKSLAQTIQKTRHDIAALNVSEIQEEHIQTATDELDAVVGATEEATGAIMDCCEVIEKQATASGESKESQAIIDQVTKIYEACSFQDITGQRISKVVAAVKTIETKITTFLNEAGLSSKDIYEGHKSKETSISQGDDRPDAHLLNGPQDSNDAISQDEIDKLLSGN